MVGWVGSRVPTPFDSSGKNYFEVNKEMLSNLCYYLSLKSLRLEHSF